MIAQDEGLESQQCKVLGLKHRAGRVKGKQVYQPDADLESIKQPFELKTFKQGKSCSTSSRLNNRKIADYKSVPWIISEKYPDRDEFTGRHFYWRKNAQHSWLDNQAKKIKKGTKSYIGSIDSSKIIEYLEQSGWNKDVIRKLGYTLEIKGHLLADPRISNKIILETSVLIDNDNPKEHLLQLLKEDKWVK
jgi:hypothetical protein